jgi:hypothetical protein
MAEIEITGIRKDNGNHYNPYEAVTHYRWVQHGTDNKGINPRQEVVSWVEGNFNAYVSGGRTRAYCDVKESDHGTRFLQTRADAAKEDNLLELEEC